MGYSSDMTRYNQAIENYNNQIAVCRQKILDLESEIRSMEEITIKIKELAAEVSNAVNKYLKTAASSDFRGNNEERFSGEKSGIDAETQVYISRIDNSVLSSIQNEISYKKQEIASLNNQIDLLERLKANLRVPRPSDYD